MTTPAQTKKNLKILYLSVLVDLFGFTSILPLFPSILAYFENNDTTNTYKIIVNSVQYFRNSILKAPEILTTDSYSISLNSILLGGFLGSWFSLLQCISAPIFTKKFKNPKNAIITSLLGSTVASYIFYKSENFIIFLVARTIGGLFEGNISITMNILSKLQNIQNRKTSMAIIGVCYSLAFIFGPLLGVTLSKKFYLNSKNFYQLPAIFSLTCSFVSLLLIVFFYENIHLNDEQIDNSKISENTNEINKHYSKKQKKSLFLIYFIYLLTFSGVEFTLGFLLLQNFNMDRTAQGKIYSIMGVIMALIQGTIVRKKASKYLAIFASILLAVGFVLLSLSNFVFLYLGLLLKALAAGCMVPSLSLIASNNKIHMGELRSVGALARSIGPILFCSIYWIYGSFVCFFIGGVLMVFVVILLHYFNEGTFKFDDNIKKNFKKVD